MRKTTAKNISVIVLLCFSSWAFADTSNNTEKTAKYGMDYDFSSLFIPKSQFLGFVGDDYQHLHMSFISVARDQVNRLIYHVKGLSKVNVKVCSFSGTVTVEEINEYAKMHYGAGDEMKDAGIRAEGELNGTYEIKEDPAKKDCGIFTGKVTLYWYVDKDSKITYDDIEKHSDSYKNNQYSGIWQPYNSSVKKTANWGEYRIPNSGDLDVGAAEFSADPKYKKSGW